MWSFWRVYNTTPARPRAAARPCAAAAAGGLARPDRQARCPTAPTITKDNLDDWIRPLLPPRGVPQDDEDAAVWNWTVDALRPGRPVYLGEPEDDGELADLPADDG